MYNVYIITSETYLRDIIKALRAEVSCSHDVNFAAVYCFQQGAGLWEVRVRLAIPDRVKVKVILHVRLVPADCFVRLVMDAPFICKVQFLFFLHI